MWGPIAGVTIATFAGADARDAHSVTGFAAGLLLHIPRPDLRTFWKTGFIFTQLGAKEINPADPTNTATFNFGYVELPVLFGRNLAGEGKRFSPFIMGGGQVGFRATCEIEIVNVATTTSKCGDAGVPFNVPRIDFGLVGGGGLNISMGSGTLTLDARYLFGVQSVDSNSDRTNRGLTLAIGYLMEQKPR